VANSILLPRLDAFTGGAFSARYTDTDSAGRDIQIGYELETWKSYPIFGVGPGLAYYYQPSYGLRPRAAHTEFTRALAEHGILGLIALVLLLIMAVQNLRQARTAWHKALVASMIGWTFLYLFINAMRLVAPAFIFGLASATFLPEENVDLDNADSNPVWHRRHRHAY
jgi:O-antigen ligase